MSVYSQRSFIVVVFLFCFCHRHHCHHSLTFVRLTGTFQASARLHFHCILTLGYVRCRVDGICASPINKTCSF